MVTLCLDTQKKYVWGEFISIENTHLLLGCPVVACARRFLHLRDNDADLDMPIRVYFERKGAVGESVISSQFVALLRIWADKIGLT